MLSYRRVTALQGVRYRWKNVI